MSDATPPSYQPQAAQPLSPSDERLWATLVHIGGIIIGFISPLLGYLLLKDRSAFVGQNAKNALNFQIGVAIGYVVGSVLTVVVIGILILLAVAVLNIVFSILAAVAANRGETYKYPLTFAFVK